MRWFQWGWCVVVLSCAIVGQVQAYECYKADILLAIDASDSVNLSSVVEEADEVFSSLARIRAKDSRMSLNVIEAIVFTNQIEHTSKGWSGETTEQKAKALVESLEVLRLRTTGTAFAPVLRYAKSAFETRPEEDRRARHPILIILTDGKGEGYNLRALKQMIDDMRRGDFKPMPKTSADFEAEAALQKIYENYLNALNGFYGASMDSLAVTPSWFPDRKTIDQLTSDSVEDLDDLDKQIEKLMQCIA